MQWRALQLDDENVGSATLLPLRRLGHLQAREQQLERRAQELGSRAANVEAREAELQQR